MGWRFLFVFQLAFQFAFLRLVSLVECPELPKRRTATRLKFVRDAGLNSSGAKSGHAIGQRLNTVQRNANAVSAL